MQTKRKTSGYVVEESFHHWLQDNGYVWFRCPALVLDDMNILWNYLAIRSELNATAQWHMPISESWQEQRCVVGATVTIGSRSALVATAHISPTNEAYSQPSKLLTALAGHNTNQDSVIVFGDFNHDIAWTSRYMAKGGYATNQKAFDRPTGLKQGKLIDLFWHKGLAKFIPRETRRIEESRPLSDHYAVLATFDVLGLDLDEFERQDINAPSSKSKPTHIQPF